MSNRSEAFVGEVFTFLVSSSATGLSDIELVITKPDGSNESSNLALSERGTSRVYEGNYTCAVAGTYIAAIVSPTDTAIAGKLGALEVKPVSKADLGGTGFDGAQHSLKNLSDKIDTVVSGQSAGKNGFIL